MADLDPETRDCIRDLCVAVAELAHGTGPLLGTERAGAVIGLARRCSERMDQLDEDATVRLLDAEMPNWRDHTDDPDITTIILAALKEPDRG